MSTTRVAVVQFCPAFGRKAENLRRMERLLGGAAADLYVFPELCTTGYFFTSRREAAQVAEPAEGPTWEVLRRLCTATEAVIVAGFAEGEGDRLFNSCLVALPGRAAPVVYRKTHLFYREKQCFDPGDTGFFSVHDTARDLRIGPMICYDWRFPEAARALTLAGADLIVCPANLVTEAWRPVMPARAIENKVFIALANRTGLESRDGEDLRFKGGSAVYGWDGRPLVQAGASEETVLVAEIDPPATRDKSFNALNDVLRDRRPEHYGRLTEEMPHGPSK
jgi:predicted amidohydrolase